MINLLGRLAEGILDGIFPPRCPGCGRSVMVNGQWCSSCLDSIGQAHCIALSAEQCRLFGSCIALCRYRHGVRRQLKQVKYNGSRSGIKALRYLAELRIEQVIKQSLLSVDEQMIVVPVPLHTERRKIRGFNQTDELFEQWAVRNRLGWQELLLRSRATKPQYSLKRQERMQNVKNAFEFSRDKPLKGEPILLVDDIFTTGATMLTCAKVLKQHGAGRLTGLVLASDAE